jgi:hypothetical protein
MSDLLHNAWQDLREKRLWPIAAVLVLALVAIPALLTKSAAQPSSVDPVVTAPVPDHDEQIRVELDGGGAASSGAGSSLGKFAEGDPFTPPGAIANNTQAGGGASSVSDGASADGGAGSGGADPDGGGVGSPPPSPGVPVDVSPPTTRTETAQYEYVADVTFWTGDRRRKVRGLRKLDMLPNQSAPVLIFMGTSGEGGNAVFLADSTLKAAGEGRCVPSPANCAYVHIGPGSEHAFTTVEGDSYRLRIEEIRRIEVKASAARGARPSARTSVGNRAASRRFELPSLVDLVAVTETTTTPGSASASENRSSVPADGR